MTIMFLLRASAVAAMLSTANAADVPTLADRVLIEKSARQLTLLDHGKVLSTYKVALGRNPIGPKERQGDGRTPEGFYTIDARRPDSGYHLALHVSYPNAQDRARASALGADPGGDIMIHGMRNGLGWLGALHRLKDWTLGCIAVTDDEMDEIWRAVPTGTTVEIRP
jgi:murein L,D-transpeptidase YafK